MIYITMSWEEIKECCNELVDKVRLLPPCEIIAVSRGGLCPAAIMSYQLKVPIFDIVQVPSKLFSTRDDLLIVDDICDTGYTFRELRLGFPHATYLSLCVKPQGKRFCNHWVREVAQDNWVVFPWAPLDAVNR